MQNIDTILDQAMALPYETRLDLIRIIQKRTMEEERIRIAEECRTVEQEYATGSIKSGSVQDLMHYLENDDD
ncbi:conserved hypothetical protein [Desulfonatronospira thiodismutans ASO3-1]|uniref:Uncharacterized protein n=1 Tax=Desulfonatronospira thiodismutans ASO3-1 TaxID=555779 RepID=D6SK33_9BACT|nr:hypothetical protein [Desulfonatronospira thiodismutans]EFI36236.1 conserved hypothetical protein [Desulfonatronospira thiodismutans ASO3-1]